MEKNQASKTQSPMADKPAAPQPAGRPGFPWKKVLIAVAGFGIIAVAGLAALVYFALNGSGSGPAFGDCVAVVHIDGTIATTQSSSLFGSSGGAASEDLVPLIAQVRKDSKYKALLLKIDSPGGSAVASKDIYDEVMAVRSSGKPVVSYIGEEAASGGYYIASASNEIVSDPNALTGSIGARFSLLNYAGLFDKLGITDNEIKSGALKDIGSESRNMTDEERALLTSIIKETADNFANDVRAGRQGKLVEPYFSQALDARVLSAKMALQAGLVDSIGSQNDALALAYGKSGIGSETNVDDMPVCDLSKRSGLDALFGTVAERFGYGMGAALSHAMTLAAQPSASLRT